MAWQLLLTEPNAGSDALPCTDDVAKTIMCTNGENLIWRRLTDVLVVMARTGGEAKRGFSIRR